MTGRWIKGAAAAVLAVTGAVSAQAADLPTRKEAPVPVFVPPPFTWTGFYIGVNAGGIWTSGHNNNVTLYAPAAPYLYSYWPSGNFGSGTSGFIGGGQAGYNWQTGVWVFGVETDFDGSTLSKSKSFIGPTFLIPAGFLGAGTSDWFAANGKISLDWLGSTRGRIGFVATPDNRLMFYGTGGVAYGGGTAHLNFYDNATGFYLYSNSGNQSRVGWTAGAGVEYAWTNNIIIGAEWLYFNLGSKTVSAYPLAVTSPTFGPLYASAKVNFDANVVRARISYKF